MDMSAIVLDEPTDAFAGAFTKNAVPGAPILIARQRIEGAAMQGVLVNNRISNVAASGGQATAQRLTTRAGELLGISGDLLFPSSTGIIGWKLPEDEMMAAMPRLRDSTALDPSRPELPLELARAIMTTDSFPKIRSRRLGQGKIMAIAKGAGMIEPNLATMLVFIMTDLDVSRTDLRSILSQTLEDSFNAISVDSDQSTSDMVLAFSSQKYPVELSDFSLEFARMCRDLSEDIVRNGEGTGHVIRITVSGEEEPAYLKALGKAVGNSPLVKTAVYGNDPNVGRILSALGDCAGNLGKSIHAQELEIRIGDQTVFRDGVFSLSRQKEELLASYLAQQSQNPRIQGYPQNERSVEISIDLNRGKKAHKVAVFASDLGHEYVRENADYRT